MKKKLAIIVMLLVAGLLLASCAGQNNGEKKLTTGDIEGTWTVSDSSTRSKDGKLELDTYMLKPDTSAVLVLRGGKINWEWEAQDGKHTSEDGGYEVKDGDVFFSSVRVNAKLEGKTLTLTRLAPPKNDGVFYRVEGDVYVSVDDPKVTEVPDKSVLVLERK